MTILYCVVGICDHRTCHRRIDPLWPQEGFTEEQKNRSSSTLEIDRTMLTTIYTCIRLRVAEEK